MDEELAKLFEQHKLLHAEVKKQQIAMLEIRRQISIRLTDEHYGLLVYPFFGEWDKWKQR